MPGLLGRARTIGRHADVEIRSLTAAAERGQAGQANKNSPRGRALALLPVALCGGRGHRRAAEAEAPAPAHPRRAGPEQARPNGSRLRGREHQSRGI